MLCRSVNRPSLIRLPASNAGTCLLWDLHLPEEEQEEDPVGSVKFSENGSLFAISRSTNLELWMTSTWERMWSVQCEATDGADADDIDFSRDGLRVFVNGIAYDVQSGDRLNQIDFIPNSMHDHVHRSEEKIRDEFESRECRECMRSFLKNGEYWFTLSDRWLSIVEKHGVRDLIHIPAEYGHIKDIKGCQGYVAFKCDDKLLLLDMSRV